MTIQFLIIHHSATSRDKTTFTAVKNYHINHNKWRDIGYHYFIEGNGKLYKGRTSVGAHCRAGGMNFKSLGICLAGNFQNESPNRLQLEQLKTLILKLKKQHNIPNSRVISHCDVAGASTACCGTNLKVLIRKDYWDIKAVPVPQKPPVVHDWKKEYDICHAKLIDCNKRYSSLKISHLELQKSREKLKTKYNILAEDYGKLKEVETKLTICKTAEKEFTEDIKKFKGRINGLELKAKSMSEIVKKPWASKTIWGAFLIAIGQGLRVTQLPDELASVVQLIGFIFIIVGRWVADKPLGFE